MSQLSYYLFDAVIALLLLVAAWRGYRKGFVLTLCGFLAIFVAFIGATIVSNILAEPVSHAIKPVVESGIRQTLEQQLPASTSSSASVELDLPLDELLALLQNSPLFRGFADAIQDAVNQGMVAATANAGKVIADYIAKQIAQIALFLISFVLILILWFFLSHALDLAFRLPVLSTLNRWSGAALGLLKGGLLLFIACQLLQNSFIPQHAIQNTYLLKFFCTSSPLSFIL
ncbi:MAG: CvpA family protein [Lawsonibacter sp.]|jgi:uncharacterized membrane protein required for colicin V production